MTAIDAIAGLSMLTGLAAGDFTCAGKIGTALVIDGARLELKDPTGASVLVSDGVRSQAALMRVAREFCAGKKPVPLYEERMSGLMLPNYSCRGVGGQAVAGQTGREAPRLEFRNVSGALVETRTGIPYFRGHQMALDHCLGVRPQ